MAELTESLAWRKAHEYRGSEDFSKQLPFSSWGTAIQQLAGIGEPFVRFYRFSNDVTEVPFDGFAVRCRKIAWHLKLSYGVEEGDRVVVAVEDKLSTIHLFGALLFLGAVIVPLDPRENGDSIRAISKRVGAKAVVLRSEDVLVEGSQIPNEFCPAGGHENPAAIFFTSGTTGQSKGVVLTQAQLMVNAMATADLHGMRPGVAHYSMLPLFHVNAFSFSFLASLVARSRLVISQSFRQLDFWSDCLREEVSVASVAPHVFELLLRCSSPQKGTLKYIVSASAPLSADLYRRFYNRFNVRVVQGYGLSEAVNFSLTIPPDLDAECYDRLMSEDTLSMGIPLFGNEVRTMDPLTGELLDPGYIGEIVIRGWNVMQGYWNDDTATVEAMRGGVVSHRRFGGDEGC